MPSRNSSVGRPPTVPRARGTVPHATLESPHLAPLAVVERTHEIGIRKSIGAKSRDILRQFLGQGLRVAGVACVCGLVLSLAVARVLSSMLYGVSATDPVTLLSVVAIVLVVASLAALVPATRAALVEPMRVLRGE